MRISLILLLVLIVTWDISENKTRIKKMESQIEELDKKIDRLIIKLERYE